MRKRNRWMSLAIWVLSIVLMFGSSTSVAVQAGEEAGEEAGKEDKYYLWEEYPDDIDYMPKNSEMKVGLGMEHVFYKEDEYGSYELNESIEEFTLEIISSDEDLIEVSVSGKSINIRSKEKVGRAKIQICGKSGSNISCEKNIYVRVVDNRYDISPQSIENVMLGETLDLNKVGFRLMLSEDTGVNQKIPEAKFTCKYNQEGETVWEVVKGAEDGGLPTLRRVANSDYWRAPSIWIKASGEEVKEDGTTEEVVYCEKEFIFDWIRYDIGFEYTYGDRTEGAGAPRLFTGTPLTVKVSAQEDAPDLPEGCIVKWVIGGEGKNYVTCEAKGLSAVLQSNLSPDDEPKKIDVNAQIYYREEYLCERFAEIEVLNPCYEYEEPLAADGDRQILVNEKLLIGKTLRCYYVDPDHPYGNKEEGKDVSVEEVTVDGEYRWQQNEGGGMSIPVEKGTVVSLLENDSGGWVLRCKDYGLASIKVTYKTIGEDTAVIYAHIEVSSGIYRLNIPELSKEQIKPGESLTISGIGMIREYVDKDNKRKTENVADFILSVIEKDGTETYNTDRMDVKVNGKSVDITAKSDFSDQAFGESYFDIIGLVGKSEEGAEKEYKECCRDTIYFDIVDPGPHSHEWGDWKTEKQATCTEKGLQTRTCNTCGEKEQKEIAALGHKQWSDWKTEKKATCTEKGLRTRTCGICKAKEQEEIAALGHKQWSDWKTEKQATCTEKGLRTRTCGICKVKEQQEIPLLSRHNSWSDWQITKQATCTEKGLRTRTCKICGGKEQEEIAALGHKSWSDWQITKQAACAEKGLRIRTCKICSGEEQEEIAALGHKWGS